MALESYTTSGDLNTRHGVVVPDILIVTNECLMQIEGLLLAAKSRISSHVVQDGVLSTQALEQKQYSTHVYSWLATYVEALRQMQNWASELERANSFFEIDALLLQIAFGEYLAQIEGGILMNQGEIGRLADLGLSRSEVAQYLTGNAIQTLLDSNSDTARQRLVSLMIEQAGSNTFGNTGLDEEMEDVRDHFRKFTNNKVKPYANTWHRNNELIPITLIDELAELGVFGLTVPEEYGGLGMSKTSMCVVSEELSRGYLGVGSLATRCEIASELIFSGGTESQKEKWLPLIASGEVLPTAVFTEPGSGSDLASLQTRAVQTSNCYMISGNKTWITHASRAHLMTLLARTDPSSCNHRGLSMFLAEKTPGLEDDPFPDQGITGTEIDVLGYRGMKEYELAFDGFQVDLDSLLGNQEGQGFRQLMETFESARIQTAARAIGVAQSALEAALEYAMARKQFGKAIVEYPRIFAKLAIMAVEIMATRQLSYFAAHQKESGRRCDVEAGMAKLLAARVAWAASDNAVQIHGGNGFALEYDISRILCDARLLSIFEGAAEIQATVIARRLLDPRVN